jgi:hypothetical protein
MARRHASQGRAFHWEICVFARCVILSLKVNRENCSPDYECGGSVSHQERRHAKGLRIRVLALSGGKRMTLDPVLLRAVHQLSEKVTLNGM